MDESQGIFLHEALMYCWWEYKMVQTLWKTIQRFLKKLKIVPPQDPTEKKTHMNQKIFKATLFGIPQNWK